MKNENKNNPKVIEKIFSFFQGCTVDAACHCQDSWNNTYTCVRQFNQNENTIYCEFSDNEVTHFAGLICCVYIN